MPKLPVVSGKRCRKALGKLGFEEVRQRGSHLVMKRGAWFPCMPRSKVARFLGS
jgi:predicted RNA binding protein YcfA (HicA-like mRNA interferase family)